MPHFRGGGLQRPRCERLRWLWRATDWAEWKASSAKGGDWKRSWGWSWMASRGIQNDFKKLELHLYLAWASDKLFLWDEAKRHQEGAFVGKVGWPACCHGLNGNHAQSARFCHVPVTFHSTVAASVVCSCHWGGLPKKLPLAVPEEIPWGAHFGHQTLVSPCEGGWWHWALAETQGPFWIRGSLPVVPQK